MTKKQDNTIFWVFGIILVVVVLSQSNISNIFQKQEEGMIGLNVHYYRDGVEVLPQKGFLGFSIVTPPGGSYDAISLSIPGTASGSIPYSNIKITDASPTAFKNSLPTTTQSLSAGQSKTLWTSGLMDTVQFESMTQPVRFWVKVQGKNDYTGQIDYKESYVDLTIAPSSQIWCYQETATAATACGGLATGSYSNTIGYVYTTYAKPKGITENSLWMVKYGGRAIENITIPQSCWAYSPTALQLRFCSAKSSGCSYFKDGYWWSASSYGQCFDGEWKIITPIVPKYSSSSIGLQPENPGLVYDGNWDTGAYHYYDNRLFYEYTGGSTNLPRTIFEEAMWWEIVSEK